MRKYTTLREDRFRKNEELFKDVLAAWEKAYLSTSQIQLTATGAVTITAITLKMPLTPDLTVFLADYAALSGVPIEVLETKDGVTLMTREAVTNITTRANE